MKSVLTKNASVVFAIFSIAFDFNLLAVVADDDDNCKVLKCCVEDCCGTETSWNGSECVPDVGSLGFTGSYSSQYVHDACTYACCEGTCCGEGTYYDTTVDYCLSIVSGYYTAVFPSSSPNFPAPTFPPPNNGDSIEPPGGLLPTASPSPTVQPSASLAPTAPPPPRSFIPSVSSSPSVSFVPSTQPTTTPTDRPTEPSPAPSLYPSASHFPSTQPNLAPSTEPSVSLKPSTQPSQVPFPVPSLTPSPTRSPYKQLGRAIRNSGVGLSSIAGRRVAIGPSSSAGGRNRIQVFDFDQNSTRWEQVGSDIVAPSRPPGSSFGAFGSDIALSQNGLTLVIGDSGNVDQGVVRVYRFNGNDWIQIGQDLSGVGNRDQLGSSVDIAPSGNVIAAGAREAGAKGQAFVYRLENGVWNQVGQTLEIMNLVGGAFGSSISLASDTTVAVSNVFGNNASIHVFDLQAGGTQAEQWSLRGESIGVSGRRSFGPTFLTISSDGNRVCAGVDALFLEPGYAQCFESRPSRSRPAPAVAWFQLGSVIDIVSSGTAIVTLSRDGQVLAVGDYGADGNGTNSGVAWVYRFQEDGSGTNGDWELILGPIEGTRPGATVGASLSLSDDGSVVAIGSGVGVNFNNTGLVRVYESGS